MKFLLLITVAPDHQTAFHAFKFAEALLANGHEISRVFFYGAGAAHGNNFITPPQDEFHLIHNWQTLAKQHALELVVCVAAALKQGVMDSATARRENKPSSNLAEQFSISGLGQLADALLTVDRCITFSAKNS
jgi:tRNA 2-thiouridine synthesizing protein D